MRVTRAFTTAGADAYEGIGFRKATSEIRNPDGSVVFRLDDIEVPSAWSQVAVDVLAQKYFRKAGIAAQLVPVEEADVPRLAAAPPPRRVGARRPARGRALRRRDLGARRSSTASPAPGPTGAGRAAISTAKRTPARSTTSCASCSPASTPRRTRRSGSTPACTGPTASTARPRGTTSPTTRTGEVKRSSSAYERPQPHACFIQSIQDDLVNPGGIMDLWVREARLFKYGSGTGTNFSSLRGENEPLSGGGRSSGLMSFLKIGDRAAGAIKSGGTTRRAAKMVVVDVDHPDIESFIGWKVREEQKVAALVAGSRCSSRHLNAILTACHAAGLDGEARFYPKQNPRCKQAIRAARQVFLPENALQQAILYARQGFTRIEVPTYATDWDSEAYVTVAGQNANNTVRVTAEFLERVLEDREWQLTRRTDGKVAKTLPARALWDQIAHAAWASADPGVQYDTTINEWHTCPASGRINASNPCSEYMFLDDTACNLASLNLIAFHKDGGGFDVGGLRPRRPPVDHGPRDRGA